MIPGGPAQSCQPSRHSPASAELRSTQQMGELRWFVGCVQNEHGPHRRRHAPLSLCTLGFVERPARPAIEWDDGRFPEQKYRRRFGYRCRSYSAAGEEADEASHRESLRSATSAAGTIKERCSSGFLISPRPSPMAWRRWDRLIWRSVRASFYPLSGPADVGNRPRCGLLRDYFRLRRERWNFRKASPRSDLCFRNRH